MGIRDVQELAPTKGVLVVEPAGVVIRCSPALGSDVAGAFCPVCVVSGTEAGIIEWGVAVVSVRLPCATCIRDGSPLPALLRSRKNTWSVLVWCPAMELPQTGSDIDRIL